jgi:histone acetyltransferase (RNA polymerase elongator complex component)
MFFLLLQLSVLTLLTGSTILFSTKAAFHQLIRKLKLPQDITFVGLQPWKPLQLHQQHLQQVEEQLENNLQQENQLRGMQEELYDQMCEQQDQMLLRLQRLRELQEQEKQRLRDKEEQLLRQLPQQPNLFVQVREHLQRKHQHMQWPREDQLWELQQQQE